MKGKAGVILIFMLALILFGYSMRVNLPPNDVAAYIHMETDNKAQWYKKVLAQGIVTVVLSNIVAKWQYYDLLVVKAAHSERLELLAVAFPFQKWRIYDMSE